MAVTDLATVANQIQQFWSFKFMKQLRESLMLGGLVNREFQGDLQRMGDTVKVSQINAPEGQLLTIGTDADTFDTTALSESQVEVKADKRAVAAYEFEDLVFLQSQLDSQDSELNASLSFAMSEQINKHLYSLVAPSTSAPDHTTASVTDFNASQVAAARKLSAQALWERTKGWWILADPSYYSDLLNDTTLASIDFGGTDAPTISGQLALQRFGFNILEDNSGANGIGSLSSDTEDQALVFHPDFLYMVMQQGPTVKISDLHAQKKFGFVMSVDVVFGAKLGIDGANKHQTVVNNA